MPVGANARVIDADGHAALAEVVGFRGNRTLLMALDADAPHSAGARVEPDRRGGSVDVGETLLGRVMDALGNPIDGLGPIATSERWPLAGKRGNPLDRARVTEPFDMGVRAINALLTAGVGQRIAIAAGSGVGKSVLMGQMIAGADADIIVVGLVSAAPAARSARRASSSPCPPIIRRCCVCAPRCGRPRSLNISVPRASVSCSSSTASPASPTPSARSGCRSASHRR
jgi:vacuolar-type H+-ATPase subunit B/Vma2